MQSSVGGKHPALSSIRGERGGKEENVGKYEGGNSRSPCRWGAPAKGGFGRRGGQKTFDISWLKADPI